MGGSVGTIEARDKRDIVSSSFGGNSSSPSSRSNRMDSPLLGTNLVHRSYYDAIVPSHRKPEHAIIISTREGAPPTPQQGSSTIIQDLLSNDVCKILILTEYHDYFFGGAY